MNASGNQGTDKIDGGDGSSSGVLVPKWLVGCIGVKLLLGFFVCLYILGAFWPTKTPDGIWDSRVNLFCRQSVCLWEFKLDPEIRFLFLVAVAAAIGSYVQVATSFTTYLGNNQLRLRWIWWYLLRVPVGIALAEIFYFALRGGFFTSGSGGNEVNPFGVAALGGLVGMFSKQAADKLQEIFEEAFKSNSDQKRGDKLKPIP